MTVVPSAERPAGAHMVSGGPGRPARGPPGRDETCSACGYRKSRRTSDRRVRCRREFRHTAPPTRRRPPPAPVVGCRFKVWSSQTHAASASSALRPRRARHRRRSSFTLCRSSSMRSGVRDRALSQPTGRRGRGYAPDARGRPTASVRPRATNGRARTVPIAHSATTRSQRLTKASARRRGWAARSRRRRAAPRPLPEHRGDLRTTGSRER